MGNYVLKLENTLLEYGVEGKIVSFKSGPIVTLFEFVPKAGIKASKVVGLSDDIARAMSLFHQESLLNLARLVLG